MPEIEKEARRTQRHRYIDNPNLNGLSHLSSRHQTAKTRKKNIPSEDQKKSIDPEFIERE